MSHHANLIGAQVRRLSALSRALEHIQGAQLEVTQSEHHFYGSIDLSRNPGCSRIPAFTARLGLRFVPDNANARPLVDQHSNIQNGHVQITIDGDHRDVVESVIGRDGSTLMDYYSREVTIDTLRELLGPNFEFTKTQEIVDGIPVLGVEALEQQTVIY